MKFFIIKNMYSSDKTFNGVKYSKKCLPHYENVIENVLMYSCTIMCFTLFV